jgi:imidazolonepropionase-like amidohydrolase
MILRLACLPMLLFLASAFASEPASTLFRNARVLTMGETGVLERAQVLVEGGRITRVSTAPVKAQAGARVIDAKGRTLMPGLADMHVHYYTADHGPLFLANGVTTVRNPWGTTEAIRFDADAKSGALAGPHVYSSGPLMDGPEPIWGEDSMQITSPELAVGAVESQRASGWSAVKLYEGLSPETYRAAVAAAQERGLQVWTHVPMAMTVEQVLELRVDSVEHFDGVAASVHATPAEADDGRWITHWAHADPERMRSLAQTTAAAGTWFTPTFAVIARRYRYGAEAEAFFRRPEMAFLDAETRDWWRGSAERLDGYDDVYRKAAARQREFLATLREAGAPVLLGTDAPNPFVLPGYAIHDEIAEFRAAGIPAEEILRIATTEAARFLGKEGRWGVVAEGARADLLLLDADPRKDLEALRRPAGVMVNGHWRDREALSGLLAALAAAGWERKAP